MSEWDYLPTPYESMVKDEAEHTMLMFLSQCSLLAGKTMTPIEIIENKEYHPVLNELMNRMTVTEFMRTMLQYEDTRGEEKKNKIIQTIQEYVRRYRKEDI